MPEHHRSKLFVTPFTQAESPDSRARGGTGLGLYLSQMVVRSIGGSIAYEPNSPHGSVFLLDIPFVVVPPSAPAQPRPPGARGGASPQLKRQADGSAAEPVLVCEDNPVNRKILTTMLERMGLQCEVACDGNEAVAKARARHFALILMDAQMPGKDGFAASRDIRALPDCRSRHVPIIAITALALAGDRERCMAAGMSDYVSKPFSRVQIKAIVDKWRDRQVIPQQQLQQLQLDAQAKLRAAAAAAPTPAPT